MSVWTPNLSWLTETLAVGGSYPKEKAAALAADHGVAAVVDLRAEACDDAAELRRCGLAFLHLPTDDHAAVSQPMLDRGVAFAGPWLASGRRVLIHCEHGIGRSATLALCVMTQQGLPPLEALRLAKQRRKLVSPSPDQYHAWVQWLARHRAEQQADWTIPDFETFKGIAYSHLRTA